MSSAQRRIFVHNLDTKATPNDLEDLRDLFQRYGQVQNCFSTKPGTGIVTMKDVKDVEAAIAGMHGFRFMGSTISLSVGDKKSSKGKGNAAGGSSGGGGGGGARNSPFGVATGGWGDSAAAAGGPSTSASTSGSASGPVAGSSTAAKKATYLAPGPRVLSATSQNAGTSSSSSTRADGGSGDGLNGVTDSMAGLGFGKDTWEVSLEDSDFDDGYRPPKLDKKPPQIQKAEWDEAYSFLKSFAHCGGSVLAVDVESWDQDQDYIIELGLAYVTWRKGNMAAPRVKVEHVVIEEHKDRRNGVYSPDAKDRFAFGKSKTLTEFDSQVYLRMLMSQLGKDNPLILLFHNAAAEKSYFELMGIEELKEFPERVPHKLLRPTAETFRKGEWSGSVILDTQRLWQAYLAGRPDAKKAPLALGKICNQLGITTKYLHNAGNDAAYTLMILTKLAQLESRAQQEQLQGH